MIVVYDEQMKNKKIKRKCIFCLSEFSSFSKEEHIIPESLGGDRILPKGFVCDQCNQYFGSNVEKNALALSPLAIARIFMSIKSKRKRHARLNGVRFEKDYKGIKFEAEGSDEADIIVRVNQDAYNDLKANKIKTLYWSFEEGMSSLVRLLIKMGLEIIATSKKLDVYDPVFDKARMAARNPKKLPGLFGGRLPGYVKINPTLNPYVFRTLVKAFNKSQQNYVIVYFHADDTLKEHSKIRSLENLICNIESLKDKIPGGVFVSFSELYSYLRIDNVDGIE